MLQQRALRSLPSFPDPGQVLVAFWNLLSSAGAFVEQPVGPRISFCAKVNSGLILLSVK